jgi:hypothetical protein
MRTTSNISETPTQHRRSSAWLRGLLISALLVLLALPGLGVKKPKPEDLIPEKYRVWLKGLPARRFHRALLASSGSLPAHCQERIP